MVQIFNLTLIALEVPYGEAILNTEQPNGWKFESLKIQKTELIVNSLFFQILNPQLSSA